MAVVTVEQVRDHLSNPSWSDSQRRACQQLIDSRQALLQDWFRVPIEPGPQRTETVPVLDQTGLVSTTYPIYELIAVGGEAAVEGMPPAPYEIRDGAWLYDPTYDTGLIGYSSRPYSLIGGAALTRVTVTYLPGWGAKADIVGAIIDKVGNIMLNRHDDTVVARNLDAEKPPQLGEAWTDDELKMLRARRRLIGARVR
jgi:hypothetical protein